MVWRIVLVIIAVGVFIYIGGGRLVVQAGNGLIGVGQGIQSVEKMAKDQTSRVIDYIASFGQEQAEKAAEKRRREEEAAEGEARSRSRK